MIRIPPLFWNNELPKQVVHIRGFGFCLYQGPSKQGPYIHHKDVVHLHDISEKVQLMTPPWVVSCVQCGVIVYVVYEAVEASDLLLVREFCIPGILSVPPRWRKDTELISPRSML